MFVGKSSAGSLANGQFERIAKAFADPRRFALFETIAAAECDCPYQKLCNQFPVTKATISHHLKELVSAGLVETERDGQFVHARAIPGVVEAYAAELIRRAGAGA
jgi:ArsR family transcriptional regulator